jgi:hypothetical protein
MTRIRKAFELACQIHILAVSAITLGAFAWLLEPMLLALLLSPIALHFWAGCFYGADHGNSRWTWRSIVLAALALLEAPLVAAAFMLRPQFTDFLWLYSAGAVLWTVGAWMVGAMALVDDWT